MNTLTAALSHPAQTVQAILQIGLGMLIQASVLLLVGLSAGYALRRHGPAIRLLVSRCTLAGVLMCLIAAVTMTGYVPSRWNITLPATAPIQEWSVSSEASSRTDRSAGTVPGAADLSHEDSLPLAPAAAGTRPFSQGVVLPPALQQTSTGRLKASEPADAIRGDRPSKRYAGLAYGILYAVLVALWGTGSLTLVIWQALCHRSLRRYRQESRVIQEGEAYTWLRRLSAEHGRSAPTLLASPTIRIPFVVGLWSPSIFVPESLITDLAPEALRALLAHEFFHLTHRDGWWKLAGRIAWTVLWFHPLLWLLCRQMDQAAEEVCDLEVVQALFTPKQYAECLLDIAGRLHGSLQARMIVTGMAERASSLERRVRLILHDTYGIQRVSGLLRIAVATATLLAVGTALATIAAPVRSVQSPASAEIDRIFRGDARLEPSAKLRFINLPLSAALADLEKRTGAKLVASREVADDKITLCSDGPLSEALTQIAKHLNFQWLPSAPGYELSQDLVGKRREEQLRTREQAAQLAALKTRMDTMARLIGMGTNNLDTRTAEIERGLQDPKVAQKQRDSWLEEQAAIQDIKRWGGSAAASIYSALNPQQIEQLAATGHLSFSTQDGTLSPELAKAVYDAPLDQYRDLLTDDPNGRIKVDPSSKPQLNDSYTRFISLPPQRAAAAIYLRTEKENYAGPPRAESHCSLHFVFESHRGQRDQYAPARTDWLLTVASPRESLSRPPTQTEDPALTRRIELQFPKPIRPEPNRSEFASQMWYDGAWPVTVTLGDIAGAIHDATGLEVVADSFVRARLAPAQISGSRRVVDILDTVARELNYDWRKEGNLISFRDHVYYWDRPSEVPERVVRPWREHVAAAGGAPTLDDLGTLAASLTDVQCRSMQDYWGWYLENPRVWITQPSLYATNFYSGRQHFRLWADLTAGQRSRALEGERIPATSLSGQTLQTFVAAMTPEEQDPNASLLIPTVTYALTPDNINTAAFTISQEPRYRQEYEGADASGNTIKTEVEGQGTDPSSKDTERFPRGAGNMHPSGEPIRMKALGFSYYLAGTQNVGGRRVLADPQHPVRTVYIFVPQPRVWPKQSP